MRDVTVTFPGVRALDGVDFRMFPGEVHSLMGENGAGKSTLVKALTGALRPDSGSIAVDGRPLEQASPRKSQALGVSTVYQDTNLLPTLSVTENIMLGRESRWGPFIDRSATQARARALLKELALDIDPAAELGELPFALQQLVAVARAIGIDAKVLVLDEPTASLDGDEVADLFRVIRHLKRRGTAILFVSHFLDQVYEIADRLTVLRDGALVGEYRTDDILRIELVHKMIGPQYAAIEDVAPVDFSQQFAGDSGPVVEAVGLGRRGRVAPFDFVAREGEVVGIAGLLGSGRTEVARLLSAVDRPDTGRLRVSGAGRRVRTPRTALRHRIVYASENRQNEGIIESFSVRDNILIALQADRGWYRPISRRRQEELATSYIQALNIRPADPDAVVRDLSGGNQQKVLLARWLAIAPRLLILDEPTRGIDIGTKAEVQRLVNDLAANGMAVVFISAELDEVLRLSTRIVVMRDREMMADIANDGASSGKVLTMIAGGGAP
jgi:simple sugar transport system ATP-binding protein|nr:sugar ABC transporter ATP-binding protein [Humibacter albus]